MDYSVYIIQSDSSFRYYVGSTNNLERRLEHHNLGFNKSTRNKGPWKLIWSLTGLTKKEAQALERKIKKRGAGRYLEEQLT